MEFSCKFRQIFRPASGGRDNGFGIFVVRVILIFPVGSIGVGVPVIGLSIIIFIIVTSSITGIVVVSPILSIVAKIIVVSFLSSRTSWIGFGAGNEGLVKHSLMDVGNELGIGGKQAVLGHPLGGGDQAVDRVQFQGHRHLVNMVNNPTAHVGASKQRIDFAVGGGSLDGALDLVQDSVKLQETALGLAVPETLAGLLHFFHQVFFMPEEGGDAEPEHVAEGLEGPGSV